MDDQLKFLRDELDRVMKERDEALAQERKLHLALAQMALAAGRGLGNVNQLQSIEGAPDCNDEINEISEVIAAAYKTAGAAVE